MFVGVSLIISIYWLINLLFIHFICACCFSLRNYIVIESPILICLYLCLIRNLQAAIGAYYDFESPNINTPSMSFVEDVTIGEGESVPPDTQFTKTWRIQNTGECFLALVVDMKRQNTCVYALTDCNSKQHILQLRLIYLLGSFGMT